MEKKILIVDDALFMRKSIRKILSEGGYTDMEEARDGEEAIALYGEYSPDLVLLGYHHAGKIRSGGAGRAFRAGWERLCCYVFRHGTGIGNTKSRGNGGKGLYREAVQEG